MSGGRGNPWELIGLLLLAGLVIEWFGSGVLMALVWIGLGIYAIYVLAPVFGGLGRGMAWLGERVERANQEPTDAQRYANEPYWQAYEAMALQDMAKVRHLVENKDVDPFAPWPAHIQPKPMLADTLYGHAVGTNYTVARKYFECCDKNDIRSP